MGKIYNTLQKGKITFYLCRYCNREIRKQGMGNHKYGKQHQKNLKKYGNIPPIPEEIKYYCFDCDTWVHETKTHHIKKNLIHKKVVLWIQNNINNIIWFEDQISFKNKEILILTKEIKQIHKRIDGLEKTNLYKIFGLDENKLPINNKICFGCKQPFSNFSKEVFCLICKNDLINAKSESEKLWSERALLDFKRTVISQEVEKLSKRLERAKIKLNQEKKSILVSVQNALAQEEKIIRKNLFFFMNY